MRPPTPRLDTLLPVWVRPDGGSPVPGGGREECQIGRYLDLPERVLEVEPAVGVSDPGGDAQVFATSEAPKHPVVQETVERGAFAPPRVLPPTWGGTREGLRRERRPRRPGRPERASSGHSPVLGTGGREGLQATLRGHSRRPSKTLRKGEGIKQNFPTRTT